MHLATLARNQGGGQTGRSWPPTKLLCNILDFQKNVMLIYVSCETYEQITDHLYFKPCFCMVQCVRDSSFV